MYTCSQDYCMLFSCMLTDFDAVTFTPSSIIPDGLDNRSFCGNVSVVFGDGTVEDDEVFLFNLTTADPSIVAITQSIYEVTIIDSTGTAILHTTQILILSLVRESGCD